MPSLPSVAQPTRRVFDPWNSSATGHQRAENRLGGSTSWRNSRTAKLASQFGDQSRGGGARIHDAVGAGALGFGKDGRKENGGWDESSVRGARGKAGMKAGDVGKTGDIESWLRGEKEGLKGGVVKELKREREEHQLDIRKREEKRRKVGEAEKAMADAESKRQDELAWADRQLTEDGFNLDDLPEELQRPTTAKSVASIREEYDLAKAAEARKAAAQEKAELEEAAFKVESQKDPLFDPTKSTILQNCVFYINGSTMPQISDHRLKYLVAQHGGLTSIALGRRTVTHVIVGTPSSKGGVGGGLAGSKIQKELDKIRGKGVKFIGVEWLLESIKSGRRLPEARFASSSLSLAPAGVKSVYGMFKQTKPTTKPASMKNSLGKGESR